MAKRFLASVADVELFERVDGELRHFASAHTLTDSSIGFQISMEDVRGGKGAKLFGRFGHTTGMTIQMTDAMFDINYLRLNLGAKRSLSTVTSVLSSEQFAWDGESDITLSDSAVSLGHLCGLEDVLCWAHRVNCKSGSSDDVALKVSGAEMKTISASQLLGKFLPKDVIVVSYFKNDPASVLYDVSATFIPGEVVAVITADEYAGDSSNVTTGEPVGQLVVKVPRLQLDGQFDIGLNMGSAATIALNGSALAAVDGVTGKEYYAEILETNRNEDFRAGLIQIAIDNTLNSVDDEPVLHGFYSDGSLRKIKNSDIAKQRVCSKSNPDGKEVNGFIKESDPGYVQVGVSSEGKWVSPGKWYVAVFPYSVTDETYTSINPVLSNEPKTGNYGIITWDSVTCVADGTSDGLVFTPGDEGECSVSDIGTCTDVCIIIPDQSPDEDSVVAIANNAFKDNTDITSVIIPETVTSIGSSAFNGCTGLLSVELSSDISEIFVNAFSGCTGLLFVSVKATDPPALGNTVFENTNNCPIYVPAANVADYKAASGWSEYADRIVALPE